MVENTEWVLVQMEVDGQQRFYRVCQEPPAGVVKAEYPNAVIVEWAFADALPDPGLTAAHKELEGHLKALDDNNPNSLLMHVYTRAGMKEWCYYVRDYPQFMAELNVALKGKPRYPIEILQDNDPEWAYWAQIKKFSSSEDTT